MSKVKGIVAKIGDGKFSKFIMLAERDGFYFNTKFDPKCGVGDEVGIEFEPKGDTRGNIKRVEILTDNGGPKGVQESSAPAASGGGGKRSFVDQQPSIVWQHSQEMAITFVGVLVANEAIKLPAAAKREDFLSTLVDDYTTKFNAEAQAAKLNSGEAAPAEDAPKAEAPADEWAEDEPKKDEWSADDEWSD